MTDKGNMDYMNVSEAAAFLGYSEGTLNNWRSANIGPKYHKPKGKIFYLKCDLMEWVSNNGEPA